MDVIKKLILKDKGLPSSQEAQETNRVHPPVSTDLARRSYNSVARTHNNLFRPIAAKGGGSKMVLPLLPSYKTRPAPTQEQMQQMNDAMNAPLFAEEERLMMQPDGIAKDFIPVTMDYEEARRRFESEATGKPYRPPEPHDPELFGLDAMAVERAYLRGEERTMPQQMLKLLEAIQRQDANAPYRAPTLDEELETFDQTVDLPAVLVTPTKRNKK